MIQTKVEKADNKSIQEAARLLQEGELVAIPTETVYGLAANALDGTAVKKIFIAKGRPQDNPLIVHIANLTMLDLVAGDVPEDALRLAKEFWPGPLTIILPRGDKVAKEVSAGLNSVGVRMPAHPTALALIEKAGIPLAAPSANRSGRPSPTSAQHVLEDMNGRIPFILDGGDSGLGVESTVIALGDIPLILRPGSVTKEDIERVLHTTVAISPAVTAPLHEGEAPESPGMKYKHYAPQAEITLVKGSLEGFCRFIKEKAVNEHGEVWALCFTGEEQSIPVRAMAYGIKEDGASQAKQVFNCLRELDQKGAKTVYARCPSPVGIGLAVYNRLLRAAAFRLVEV